jgi:hypothetical protein
MAVFSLATDGGFPFAARRRARPAWGESINSEDDASRSAPGHRVELVDLAVGLLAQLPELEVAIP